MQATGSSIAPPAAAAFPIEETHGIPLYPGNRLLAHSGCLGWRSAYASYAAEQPWTATLRPLPHTCIAYFVNGGATITRQVEGEARQVAQLHVRQFGFVPTRAASDWALRGTPDVLTLYLRHTMVDRLAVEVFGRDPQHVELRPQLGVTDPLLEQLALTLLRGCRRAKREPLSMSTTLRRPWRFTCSAAIAVASAPGRRRQRQCRFRGSPALWTLSTRRWTAS